MSKEERPDSPDYESGSSEDDQHPSPTAKEAETDEDEKLPDDQGAFQPDSS